MCEPEQPLFSSGTRVVTLTPLKNQHGRVLHPRGSVAIVVRTPRSDLPDYRVRFPDGLEETMLSGDLTTLTKFTSPEACETTVPLERDELFDRVILQCVVGSQAYGLSNDQSDVDRRGIYLPPARRHWSLSGVPEQLECHVTQETYWELQKFIVLALKSNPTVLECLYSPLIEKATPLARQLLQIRSAFLSRQVYQTYNGYVMSQFRRMQADVRNRGQVRWKHAMHLIRLLLSGVRLLREGFLPVQVEDKHHSRLLELKAGNLSWDEMDQWRQQLHQDFDQARDQSPLPDTPDYQTADDFLHTARHAALQKELP